MTQILFIAAYFTTCIVTSLHSFLFHSFTSFPLVVLSSFFFSPWSFPFLCLSVFLSNLSFIHSVIQSVSLTVCQTICQSLSQSFSHKVSLSVNLCVCLSVFLNFFHDNCSSVSKNVWMLIQILYRKWQLLSRRK